MSTNPSQLPWCARQRQKWIAEMLEIYGFINRKHLNRKFGISAAQVSIDLNHFDKNNPGVMAFDVHRKTYIATNAPTKTDHMETTND